MSSQEETSSRLPSLRGRRFFCCSFFGTLLSLVCVTISCCSRTEVFVDLFNTLLSEDVINLPTLIGEDEHHTAADASDDSSDGSPWLFVLTLFCGGAVVLAAAAAGGYFLLQYFKRPSGGDDQGPSPWEKSPPPRSGSPFQ